MVQRADHEARGEGARSLSGVVGAAVDAIVGRRIAEATVHQFVKDVSARLREVLAKR